MSSILLIKENNAANAAPAHTAGITFLMGSVPRRIWDRVASRAAGRKKRRLIPRAVAGSKPAMPVRNRISRLPPPKPIPARSPQNAAAKKAIRAIDTESLPIKSEFPTPGEATMWEYAGRPGAPASRPRSFQAGRGGRCPEKGSRASLRCSPRR